jgi:hypothetical protein
MSDMNENEPQRQHHRLATGQPLQGLKNSVPKIKMSGGGKTPPKAALLKKHTGRGR